MREQTLCFPRMNGAIVLVECMHHNTYLFSSDGPIVLQVHLLDTKTHCGSEKAAKRLCVSGGQREHKAHTHTHHYHICWDGDTQASQEQSFMAMMLDGYYQYYKRCDELVQVDLVKMKQSSLSCVLLVDRISKQSWNLSKMTILEDHSLESRRTHTTNRRYLHISKSRLHM